jgi:predicted regulator of Ras-like GTPase activity (Roadblock/LC7/MglB family)
VDAQRALDDLTEISSQIRAAVVFDDKGKLAGSTAPNGDALARAAADLVAAAEDLDTGNSPLTQFEVATADGSVFVVRQGKVTIAATTSADPTVGLVFYDLKSALRGIEEAKPKPAARKRKATAAAKEPAAVEKRPAPKKPAAKKKAAPRKEKPDAS